MKTIYRYLRDDRNRPVVTICLASDGQKVGRGMAICSPNDNPCKATGRRLAYHRAMGALKANNCEVFRRHDAIDVFLSTKNKPLRSWIRQVKVDPDPGITEKERELLAIQ